MPPDVELSEMTAGGLLEPKAEWTQQARQHVGGALRAELARRQAQLIEYRTPAGDSPRAHQHAQLVKLHDLVGGAIIIHKYGPPALHLPTKENMFDWSLGDGVSALREDHDAQYALFVLFRDTYASGGRVAAMVGAAILGVALPGGRQVGFASLVDLRSGDIIWFNRLLDTAGDLRSAEPAGKAVKSLLDSMPE